LDKNWTKIGQKLDKNWTKIGQKLDKNWTKICQKILSLKIIVREIFSYLSRDARDGCLQEKPVKPARDEYCQEGGKKLVCSRIIRFNARFRTAQIRETAAIVFCPLLFIGD
jgi:hypothetical protein